MTTDRYGLLPARIADDQVVVLLMAYGTPRSREEILPYYTDIRRGRPPTPELLAELTARYEAIGGVSPLAALTEAQRDTLQDQLDRLVPGRFVVTLGLKHAAPMIEDAVAEVGRRGARRVVGLVLAPHYSSYSIGQYLDRTRAAAAPFGIEVAGVESWATLPAYVSFLAAAARHELEGLPARTHTLFTAHSLPQRIIDAGDPYPHQLRATADEVAAAVGLAPDAWSIAWQSAGRTPEPWIGPDILAVIDELAGTSAADGVLVCPCGFVADHLEVLYDLDIEARAHAGSRGLRFARTASLNADPAVLGALAARVAQVAA
jgi:ferrochelatase